MILIKGKKNADTLERNVALLTFSEEHWKELNYGKLFLICLKDRLRNSKSVEEKSSGEVSAL